MAINNARRDVQAKNLHDATRCALAKLKSNVRTHKWALATLKSAVRTRGGANNQRMAINNARRNMQAKSMHATTECALAKLRSTARTHKQHPTATFGVQYASRRVWDCHLPQLTNRQAFGCTVPLGASQHKRPCCEQQTWFELTPTPPIYI